MRDTHERRQPHATNLYPFGGNPLEVAEGERRKISDRRMENLTLEERQLLFSEMPALPSEYD